MPLCQYKNLNVHYTETGSGRALVLLHGFLENLSMWDNYVSALSKRYRVVCIDLLGHGKSDCHGYVHTMEDMAEGVKAVLSKTEIINSKKTDNVSLRLKNMVHVEKSADIFVIIEPG